MDPHKVISRHRKKYAVANTRGLAMLPEGQAGSRQIVLYDGDLMHSLLENDFWGAWEESPDVFRGFLDVQDPSQQCGNVYKVAEVLAKRGYGPLLYDIALTYARLDGMDGVIPDRRSVSPAALNIWKYYATQRRDVTRKPIEVSQACKEYPEEVLNYVYSIQRPVDLGSMLRLHKQLAKKALAANLYEDEYNTLILEEGWGHWQSWAEENL